MRRPSAGRITALLAAGLLLPALAACGSDDKGGSATGSDSALVIYSGRNEKLVEPLLDKLEKAVGSEVEVRYGDSAELAAQILEEGDRTKAGLFFSQDAGALGALSREGMLAKLPQSSLDEVDASYRGGAGDWVGLSGRVRVIAYNPDEIAEEKVPDSVHDVVKPEWKGKVGFAPTNASFQAFVTGMRVLEGDDATREWLKGLKANGKTYAHNLATLDGIEAGEVEIGLVNHYYWYERVAEKGEDNVDAKLHFLPGNDPGALINVAGVGILKDSGQTETAQKAVDYLLSKEAQTYFADTTKEYPLAAGVTSTVEDLPPFDSLESPEIDLGKLESLQETLAMLQDVGLV
ncbi:MULTISPECIES: iron ABC transporter substrate-binding protein [Streptomyces]|uniref:Iron ABC transporter substrate-binding protein n=1 Tax=Streptomyces caniscabiei TaxID=2746961 RepID=A0ABU4N254_9ACTN|nr:MULTISPECIES: iron ABC transporter substrate-binding protein [Streptomyces]MBE4733332.1 iron ABC transporter substrate-binding protein [Streptomyces caniscabiei]MBE4754510.1 iron ABC transporter substrate-binding protein [Streptomyces caniscabiei]MBE4768669.1 iron ABC transporter substrate-binding protein [Streptomyces caniscabiei]MBE4781827.1 iron ABC transporter substrate-binding protein [Streptomyces caniscabiei]MBE4793117.1 iron ABC transporter substrate-binding protein [Streptomyces ca